FNLWKQLSSRTKTPRSTKSKFDCFPRWTSRFRSTPPAVRIKALQANHIPRFQTDSVRSSAGRQELTPLDVKPGETTVYRIQRRAQEIGLASLYMRTENPARRRIPAVTRCFSQVFPW